MLRRAPWIVLAALFAACNGDDPEAPDVDETPGAEEQDLPSEYVYTPEEEDPAAELDVEALALDLEFIFGSLLDWHGEPVIDLYQASMAGVDDGCPTWYENDGFVFWYAACTSDFGSTYEGFGYEYNYVDADIYGDGSVWNLDYIYGVFAATDSQGNRYDIGGGAQFGVGVYEDDGVELYQSYVVGSFGYSGATGTGSWLDTSLNPNLYTYVYSVPEWDVSLVYVDGQFGGLDEITQTISSLDFDDFQIADTAAGWPCSDEGAGRISARDLDGTWWEIVFDVDAESWAVDPSGSCDGCGAVYRGGEYVTDICFDPSAVLDFQETPW